MIVQAPKRRCLDTMIERWARVAPGSPAVEAPGLPPLTYGALYGQMVRVASTLSELGIGQGDRVATVLRNGPEAAVAFLALAARTACAPLNPNYSESEFDFYLSDLDPKALIVFDGDDSPAVPVAKERGIPVVRLVPIRSSPARLFKLRNGRVTSRSGAGRARPEDVALVLHTSGTTSRPKIVPLTHANLTASASAVARTLELTPSDRCLNVMPLFYIHGLVASVLATLSTGGCVVCTPGFDAADFFEWIETMQPTWYTAEPTMHQTILARASRAGIGAHSLRFICSSSASLSPDVAAKMENTFGVPVIEAYGMTEAAHQMACNPPPPGER